MQINKPFKTPIDNDHYGFEWLDIDFEGRLHAGEDLNGKGGGNSDKGLPVHPIGHGVVSFIDTTGTNYGWGNLVYIRHDMVEYFKAYGVDKPNWCPNTVWSQYAHLNDVQVVEGQEVNTNDVIGGLGGTPYWSAHLHHEVRKMALGVYFYPKKGTSKEWIEDHYFQPSIFVQEVNAYVQKELNKTPVSDVEIGLIKYTKRPEVYYYTGARRHHVPDEATAIALFGADWIDDVQDITKKQMGLIATGEPFPSLKI